MRNLIAAVVGAMAMMIPAGAIAAEKTVQLSVPGMTCASCPYIVEQSILALPGIKTAKATFERRMVTVTFDDEAVSLAAIMRATADSGYESMLAVADGNS